MWQAILIGLRGLGRFLGDDDFPRFQARVADLLRPVVADLGDPVRGESDLTGKLRGLVTASLAVLGADEPTVERCRQLYDASVADPGIGASRARRRGHIGRGGDRWSRRLRPAVRRLQERLDPPGPAAPPVRPRRVRRRGVGAAHVRAVLQRRREDPERPVRAARVHRPTAGTGRQRGRSCASAGTTPTRRSRTTRSSAWSTRSSCSPRSRSWPTSRAFFAEHPIPQAGQDARPDPRAPAGQRRRPDPRSGSAWPPPCSSVGARPPLAGGPRYSRRMRRIALALVAASGGRWHRRRTPPPPCRPMTTAASSIVRQQAETAAAEYFATAVEGGASHVACETPSADAAGVVFYCFGVNSGGAPVVAQATINDYGTAEFAAVVAGRRRRRRLRRPRRARRRLGPGHRQPGGAGRPDHRPDDRRRHPRRQRSLCRAAATGRCPCRGAVGVGDRSVVGSLPRRARRDDLRLRHHRRRRLDADGRAAQQRPGLRCRRPACPARTPTSSPTTTPRRGRRRSAYDGTGTDRRDAR